MTARLIKLSAASLAQDKDNKMALPIITADQTLLVQAIIVYLYADPGLGKSSMGFTAEKAISFDFDRGAHRTGELRRGAVVQVQQWNDVANLTPQDLAPYKTIVLDTVGAMLECIKTHLLLTANNRQKDGSYYGLAPHIHTKPIGGTVFLDESFPENFSPDGDGLGMYTHCLNCGGDGTFEGTQLEVKAESKEG